MSELEKSTLSAEGFPAKAFPLQAEKQDSRIEKNRVFGMNTKDLLKKLNRDSSLSKMYEICSISDLQKSSKICATSGMMRNGKLFQRAPLAQDIYENESGLLPTPTAQDYKARGPNSKQQGLRDILDRTKRLDEIYPTPTCRDSGLPLPQRKKQDGGGQKPPLVFVLNGRLDPLFVEWLMGYPIGWSDIEGRESSLLVTQ